MVVIGAGPSGSIAAALLKRRGRDVLVLERAEVSALLDRREPAGALPGFRRRGRHARGGGRRGLPVQERRGVRARRRSTRDFDFGDSVHAGPAVHFQVQRATFDKLLADEAAKQGVEIRYEVEIVAVGSAERPRARSRHAPLNGEVTTIEADFMLDASGFGRTLPKLLDLETPSDFPVRQAVFTHVADRIPGGRLRSQQDPRHRASRSTRDVWYWLIPFRNGRCSLGVRGAQGVPRRLSGAAGCSGCARSSREDPVLARAAGECASGTRRCASWPATPPT